MNREDIIRMASEAGLDGYKTPLPAIERFAALVAAHERESMPDRRERIATAAMQGIMASGLVTKVAYSELAEGSIRIANALIEELDKPKEVKP